MILEYLYVIAILDRNEIKFGRTDNWKKRFQKYKSDHEQEHGKNNVKQLYLSAVSDSTTFEKEILNHMYNDSRVTLMRGKEYFHEDDFPILLQYIEEVVSEGHKRYRKKLNQIKNQESTISKEAHEKYKNESITRESVERLIRSDKFVGKELEKQWIDNPQHLQSKLQEAEFANCSDITIFDNSLFPNLTNKISIDRAFSILKDNKIMNTCSKCNTPEVLMHRRKRDTKYGNKNEPYTYCIDCY